MSLSLALRLTLSLLESDPAGPAEHLRGAQRELPQGLEELRELARGIHPAILTERGLRAAVDSLVLRAQVPVDVIEMPEGRLPPEVEAAAYYVVSESVANVTRYAEADRATVAVVLANGTVTVEVVDDGQGGADAALGSGPARPGRPGRGHRRAARDRQPARRGHDGSARPAVRRCSESVRR